ncbi:unnamed protein product [Rhizophagus irregularis]|uniref:Uncharacterized protein n=4 Tax=Rhizophagus irregularis TaxID=588596 RepID=A0A916DWV6_9GLOM|nr:hypothetical protein GLOIN_2v1564917 [Rhizophagus irregularis DAOM 181602=DAOM 197198]CAB4482118.1 unnamed protein product [Rhizophagus irregularis]POG75454.1 hypothetical protein GLOIN_2v1564917 [Rhizophagus irregularis DAOM 181602=DAOM 197198]CAB5184599.1 unnamed protein product [Rhizophagus irregularis]CAB5300506.1 unnamed protein product [Rhizophagus irregularis]GET66910.1 hypothetical protein GLOIN_2v1564917 [Rhizophagus irregularis DAOM 181602=DAOM 197198]|eukprot:XP_025182320.1 hypothetical protein GLOIN_2v1564917 [Rhizophagus irregularis DAOM 181602=DAOM 197198]
MEPDLYLEKRTTLASLNSSFQQKFISRPSTQNNELNLPQQKNESSSQEDLKCHDRIYLMQQKSEQYRNEISRLKKAIDVRKSTLLYNEHITKRNNALEENLLNVYEIITESITHSFGSIREIYNLLRRVIDDDDKALDKANDEANKAIQEIHGLCKKIDDLKQQNGFPWRILDNTRNQGKDEDVMDVDVSNDKDMIANIDLKSLLEQYDKTESLVDELSNDLEQLENSKDEMILWKFSHAKNSSNSL